MLFIRMQGWRGGMDRGHQQQQMWLEQLPTAPGLSHPTLGHMKTVMAQRPAWQHFRDCHQTETKGRTCVTGTSSGAEVTMWGQSCLAVPGRWQAEGGYITTFSFSLEQYEAKSLEMISAYWRSTLLMVCSQMRDGTHPDSSKEKKGGKQRDYESHSKETTQCLDTPWDT